MDCRISLTALSLVALCAVSTSEPAPQYFPLPFPDQHAQGTSHGWPQTLANNSASSQSFLDPLSATAEEIVKNDVPRQTYIPPSGYQPPSGYPVPSGFPQYSGYPQQPGYSQRGNFPPPTINPQPSSGYPQIYKLDNLIIIANPPQTQSCPQKLDNAQFPRVETGIGNRFGSEEPSKCTWAIISCCSPNSNEVRYSCFELLGCGGYFLDGGPCQADIVMAAADAALKFYSGGNNNATRTTDNNNL